MKRFLIVAAALLASSLPAFAGGIVVPAEQRYIPYSGDLEPCNDPVDLAYIQRRFGEKESVYWNSPLQIVSFDHFKQLGYRSNGLGLIPRRFCVAQAHMNDLKTRKIIYQIEEHMAFAGYGNNEEWCVVGLDRNLAYAPSCAILQPLYVRYEHDELHFPPN
jgi:hypothetical protein